MYLFVNCFCKINIDWPRIPHHMIARASIISESEASITVLCLLGSPRYTAVWIKNCSKSMSVIKVATARNTIVPRGPHLSSETEVSIALLYQLCSTCYTVVRIKKCLKSTSVLKVATMKNTYDFSLRKGSHQVQPPNQRFSLSAKMNGTQRRTLVSPWRIHCTHCGVPKGTSRVEQCKNQARSHSRYRVMLDWRHQSVRQSGSQSVIRKFR